MMPIVRSRKVRSRRIEAVCSLRPLRLALVMGSLVLVGCITYDEQDELHGPESNVAAALAGNSADRERGEPTLAATLGCPTYDERSRHCLLLKIDYGVDSGAGASPITRPPLNIALVLDRSSSMRAEEKLPYALATAHWLVQNLTERDMLSIIAVDERATLLAAAGPIVNKPFLHHRLDDVFASDGTADLSAGLREGMAQMERVGTAGRRTHVTLLTDGLTARAQAVSADLEKIVKQASPLGISVSTFGVGKDHNGRLLVALAAVGGGRAAYIRMPEQFSTAFRTVLGEPLPLVARDAAIRVTMKQGHIGKVYRQLPAPPIQTHIVPLGALRAADRGFVLAQLEPAAYAFGTTVEGRVSLDFTDPLTGRSQSQEVRLQSSYAAGAQGASRGGEPSSPSTLADVLAALETADSAARGLDLDAYRQFKASFELLYGRAHEYAVRNRDQELLNQVFVLGHLMEELDAANKEGLLHGHEQARAQLPNERDYLLYLLTHHRP